MLELFDEDKFRKEGLNEEQREIFRFNHGQFMKFHGRIREGVSYERAGKKI